MWIFENLNPIQARVGDCAVRAVAKALGITWGQAYTRLFSAGYLMGDMPSSNNVWGAVLREAGFERQYLPNTCPDCYTVADFCADHPAGTYVLGLDKHAVTVVDGDWFDIWDSGNEPVLYFWHKPNADKEEP